MSVRVGAPYSDRVLENGRVLIYEGHDVHRTKYGPNPKTVDQSMTNQYGSLTENGKFFEAARDYKNGSREAEKIKVYEKIKKGIWVYNGTFDLMDANIEESHGRNVFKFRLEVTDALEESFTIKISADDLKHTRMIPSDVKLSVWKRDKGKCKICGSNTNLHFDHVVPYSKGGTSFITKNVQLLCAYHNLSKSDKIE